MLDSLHVCIIDDDIDQGDVIQRGLRYAGIESYLFSTAEELLASDNLSSVGCLVVDINLPGISGLQLQSELTQHNLRMPVIMTSGKATASCVIRAYEQGAVTFFEKPFAMNSLLVTIEDTLAEERIRREQDQIYARRFSTLTNRESEVLDRLVIGKSTKIIARELGISPSTAEKHRAKILVKTGFDSVVDLIRFLLTLPSRDHEWRNSLCALSS